VTPRDTRTAATAAEARLSAAWLAIVETMRSARTTDELADLLASGRFEEATAMVTAAARRFSAAWTQEFVRAAELTADDVERALRNAARGEVVVDFDLANEGAVRVMRENQLRLVREVSDQQRRAMREAMQDGMNRGLNPRAQARAFRDSIGLTQHQVRSVNNYRRLLETNNPEALQRALRDRRFDPSIRRALESGKPLTRTQIDNMVRRYRERFIAHRAETIGRTEALRSVHQGAFQMYRQAVESGHVAADEMNREWNTAGDERVRTFENTGGQTSHASMQGQVVQGLDTPFISGAGNQLLYPGDPSAPAYDTIQCRCVVGVRLSLAPSMQPLSVEVL